MRTKSLRFASTSLLVALLASSLVAGCKKEDPPADMAARDMAVMPDVAMPDLLPAGPDLMKLSVAPRLDSVEPKRGPTRGGTELILTGDNFLPGLKVLMGGKDVPATRESATKIRLFSPERPAPGLVRVEVVNIDDQRGVIEAGFTFEVTTVEFALSKSFPTGGTGATGGALADITGDGKLDVVIANMNEDALVTLAGKGDGTLGSPETQPTGDLPVDVIAADFNGDQRVDIATADRAGDQVSVFLNTPGGKLAARVPLAMPAKSVPLALATADLDGDGKRDLVTLLGAGSVASNLGGADGKFQPAKTIAIQVRVSAALAAGAFDAEPKLDVMVGYTSPPGQGSDYLGLLGGAGDGTFKAEVSLSGTPRSTSLLVADVNGDKRDDLVSASNSHQEARVLLGSDKGIGAPVVTALQNSVNAVAAGDLNLDGKIDLVVANNVGSARVLIGRGDGNFDPLPAQLSTGSAGRWVGVGDLDGDGLPDIVIALVQPMGDGVLVFRNASK